LPSEFRKRGGAASKDARPDDKRCTPSVLQRQSSALGQAPPDVSDLNAVIVIEEQDDARKECSAKGGEEVRPGGAEVRATGTPKGRGQSPDAAEQVQRVKEADNGHAVASGGKRAKGAGATPGCCWKCGATKSTDWLALYVDGLPHQLCKGCQVYHKDNRIVVDALLPEEADAQEAGDCEFGHPSNLHTRAQQRAPEHQGIAHAADVTMGGRQMHAWSAQDSSPSSITESQTQNPGPMPATTLATPPLSPQFRNLTSPSQPAIHPTLPPSALVLLTREDTSENSGSTSSPESRSLATVNGCEVHPFMAQCQLRASASES